jgi:SAM-dependent methyltransferase
MSTPASHHAFYDDAHAYDVAFSYRDVDAELAFLLAAAERHGARGAPKSFLELAAGPGYHAVKAAQRGLRAIALDLSAPMIERAKVKAEDAGVVVEGIVADMARFTVDAPVDLACNLLTSISYLVDVDDLLAHFASVAAALNPGGVYVVENNHPNDFWTREHFQPSRWTMSSKSARGEVEVFTSWIDQPPTIDVVRQTYSAACRTEVTERGPDGATTKRTLQDQATLRMIWPQELRAYAEANGFRLARFYGELNDAVAIDDAEAWRTVAVFVRG